MTAASSRFAPYVAQAAILFAATLASCGSYEDETALQAWYDDVDQVQVAQSLDRHQDGLSTSRRMRAAGFAETPDSWRRDASLTATPALQPFVTGALPNVGAVSVLSIDRRNGETPYLYATLRSLFAELPADEPVNIFVGDDQLDYVQPEVLTRELGDAFAARVYIIGSASADVAYMRAQNFDVWERSSWNYARMLRAYDGPGYHLTFEDDVVLARGSLGAVNAQLGRDAAPIVSLYNPRCERTPGLDGYDLSTARLVAHRHERSKGRFWGTQAVAYHGPTSARVGRHIQASLGEQPFDWLVDRYMRREKLMMGYMLPSVVQHTGVLTTGLGFHHQSSCYVSDYPQIAD